MILLVMAAHETFEDHTDVQQLARQLLHRTIGENDNKTRSNDFGWAAKIGSLF